MATQKTTQQSADLKREREELRKLVESSKRVVFFGGAGVSTESGIPDFRSAQGIYNQKYPYPPETIVSHTFFVEHPDAFYEFYRQKMVFPDAQPNPCHRTLARLEAEGIVRAVVTQNIDGLHQAAGSKNVFELHGSIHRNHCVDCSARFGLDAVVSSAGIPRCTKCGGIIKPDVVLYEEPLDDRVVEGAIDAIANADMLIVAGTSLAVYPAASFLGFFHGDTLALVNRTETPLDERADFLSRQNIGAIMDWQ